MKSKTGKLNPFNVILGLIALGLVVVLYFYNHVPLKGYYDQNRQELVIQSGFLYSLEDYSFGYRDTYAYPVVEEILTPLSAPTDPEYRFQAVSGDYSAGIDLLISYRDCLSGELHSNWIQVEREDSRNSFWIFGGGVSVSFTVSSEK